MDMRNIGMRNYPNGSANKKANGKFDDMNAEALEEVGMRVSGRKVETHDAYEDTELSRGSKYVSKAKGTRHRDRTSIREGEKPEVVDEYELD